MELVGGAGATQDVGDGLAEREIAGLTQVTWRKSSWSSFNGNCVEVAELCGERVGVRDTKNRGLGPVLLFEGAAWRSFIDGVKNGRLPSDG
jgi:Domain of unknown function (DUF397)